MLQKIKWTIFLLLLIGNYCFAQCPKYGDAPASDPDKRQLNTYKNRTSNPGQVKSTITLNKLLSNGEDEARFKNTDAAEITGYVVKVILEGPESCNCHSEEKEDHDYHIIVASNKGETDQSKWFVVEVTPRVRAKKGEAWSHDILKSMKDKKVKFKGWMFYDTEHTNVAYNSNPAASTIHRATVWEIHPVTRIIIL